MARPNSEAGFTLVELLIVATVLAFTMAAVFGIYQVTQRSILFSAAGEEAQVSTRAVLDRIIFDLRMINNGRTVWPNAITAATTASITFLSDIDNDTLTAAGVDATTTALADVGANQVPVSSTAGFSAGEQLFILDNPVSETRAITGIGGNNLTLGTALTNWYSSGSIVRSAETVYYAWDQNPLGGNLCRSVGAACTFTDADIIATGVTNFQLTYLNSTGGTIANTATQPNRDLIRAIQVSISVLSRSGDQVVTRTMAATVRPRNLAE